MKTILSAFVTGGLFGAGLALSGMMNPAKVLGFLDVFGVWDPTLAFVMGGALLITVPGFWLVRKRGGPLFGGSFQIPTRRDLDARLFGGAFQIPTRRDLDARLIGGAAIFGLGWGIAGFCPGPAVAALSSALPGVFLFVAAMLAGMLVHRFALERRES